MSGKQGLIATLLFGAAGVLLLVQLSSGLDFSKGLQQTLDDFSAWVESLEESDSTPPARQEGNLPSGRTRDDLQGVDMAELINWVETSMGQAFPTPPTIERMDEPTWLAWYAELIDAELPTFASPASGGLWHFSQQAWSDGAYLSQVFNQFYLINRVALYDADADVLYLRQAQTNTALNRGEVIGELVHAMQDQTRDYAELKATAQDQDQLSAIQAMLFGESLTQQIAYLEAQGVTGEPETLSHALREILNLSGQLDQFEEMGAFVYQAGLDFVQAVEAEHDWQARLANPPASTHEILHPRLYTARPEAAVALPDFSDPDEDHSLLTINRLGEAGWRHLLLSYPGITPADLAPLANWENDGYRMTRTSSGNTHVLFQITLDTRAESMALFETFRQAFDWQDEELDDFLRDNTLWFYIEYTGGEVTQDLLDSDFDS